MSIILSHPHLRLEEHIRQVQSALGGLFNWHSPLTVTDELRILANQAAVLHDVGKATQWFQEYIKSPATFSGDKTLKVHTPLSLVFVLVQGQFEHWLPLDVLTLSFVVRGHHGSLATLPRNSMTPAQKTNLNPGEQGTILEKQLGGWQVDDLSAVVPFNKDAFLEDGKTQHLIYRTERYFSHEVLRYWKSLSDADKMTFRFKTQLVFSWLLEADKALLAVKNPETYLAVHRNYWDPRWVNQYIASRAISSSTNFKREVVRSTVLEQLEQSVEAKIFSLTAPTGIGKTLLAASWALHLRDQMPGPPRKIIIVLPYLSIIDQTILQYHELLKFSGKNYDKSWLLPAHSLADRAYKENMEQEEESFFIDTWRSELIVTTYDQFLMAIFDDRARYQMRFHNLWDALIVLDEVQSLPTRLWTSLDKAITTLVELSQSRVLLMSATLPSIVPQATPLLPEYITIFRTYQRYAMHFNLEPTPLEVFVEDLVGHLPGWLENGDRVLITVNTRASARAVLEACEEVLPADAHSHLYFITADVTPKDRMAMVRELKDKKNTPCIVVSTQTVESGVDIDMSVVIRDFAPWDSLVQIAGRCNREGERPRETVEIRYLLNDGGSAYCEQIYDAIHLSVTHDLVHNGMAVLEEDTVEYSQQYFERLALTKDTGRDYWKQYINFQPRDPVHQLLRGKNMATYDFLVLAQDPGLKEAMKAAQDIADRWKRREAWRQLAGRIANITVQVWARPGFNPHSIANPCFGELWEVRDGYYTSRRGLDLAGETLVF